MGDKFETCGSTEELEAEIMADKQKLDFALRQVAQLMEMAGLAGIRQRSGNYMFNIEYRPEELITKTGGSL